MKIIKDYPNYAVSKDGNVYNIKTNRCLKKVKISSGYHQVYLYKNKISKSLLVHRLIAMTYLPNKLNKSDVNHINGIKTDNRLENLEWVTRSENLLHSFKLGMSKVNEKNKARFLKMVKERVFSKNIILNIENGIFYNTVKEISIIYGLNYHTIKNKLNGYCINNTNFIKI